MITLDDMSQVFCLGFGVWYGRRYGGGEFVGYVRVFGKIVGGDMGIGVGLRGLGGEGE